MSQPIAPTHYVKIREAGKKRWLFLTSKGSGTRLKVHAARFTAENSDAVIEEGARDNADWEFRAVPIGLPEDADEATPARTIADADRDHAREREEALGPILDDEPAGSSVAEIERGPRSWEHDPGPFALASSTARANGPGSCSHDRGPFALAVDDAPDGARLPWCVRPIAAFLKRERWAAKDTIRVERLGNQVWGRLELDSRDDPQARAIADVIERAQEMILDYHRLAKVQRDFPRALPVAPPTPVATPATRPGVAEAPTPRRPAIEKKVANPEPRDPCIDCGTTEGGRTASGQYERSKGRCMRCYNAFRRKPKLMEISC